MGPDSDGCRCQTNKLGGRGVLVKQCGMLGTLAELEHRGSLQWGADAASGPASSRLLDHLSFF